MTEGVRARFREFVQDRPLQVLTVAALVAATAAAAAPGGNVQMGAARQNLVTAVEKAVTTVSPPVPAPMKLVWEGLDLDGDGKADFANPTGQEARGHDAYGAGGFGASRDGGVRRHEGVDFVADAGQAVVAPVSGYVTKIGYAYASDMSLRFVEITNPALRIAARVFYVNPKVAVGDAVAVGTPIATAKSLQRKYPGGMTDHVHLEIIDKGGRRIDAEEVLTAQLVPDTEFAAAD